MPSHAVGLWASSRQVAESPVFKVMRKVREQEKPLGLGAACTDWVDDRDEYDWDGPRCSMQCSQCWCTVGHDHVWCEGDEFGRRGSRTIRVASPPANLHSEIVALCPAQLPQSLPNSADTSLSFWIGLGICHQHTDPPHGHTLRPRRATPPRRRAAR